jgi:hypothetical protein
MQNPQPMSPPAVSCVLTRVIDRETLLGPYREGQQNGADMRELSPVHPAC